MKNSKKDAHSELNIYYPKNQVPSGDKTLEVGSYKFAYKYGEYASGLPK